MGGASVQKKGKGLAQLIKIVDQLKIDPEVRIGIFQGGGPRTGSGPTNVEIGIIHEFGAPGANIPERSFLRRTADHKRKDWLDLMARALGKVVDGKITAQTALGLVGQRASADVKQTITRGAGVPPPLKDKTIAAKGSSRPLVDTGQLVNSITYKVHVGSK